MLREGAPLVINDPHDARLVARSTRLSPDAAGALVCVPIKYEEQLLGALEILNWQDGGEFSEDDCGLAAEIARQAGSALRNAQRHEAERKVKELNALLRTSREITSTLDLDRMLAVVVNQVATIIPFDRCAIALVNKGRYQINAIAGEATVNRKDAQVKAWNEVINWLGQTGAEHYISEEHGEINADHAQTREKLRAHFDASGMRSLYALPLADEEGQLGVLVLESKTPQFLTDSHLEVLKIFAGQATVALRNAQLYRQLPLISALEPLAARRRAFFALPRAKRSLISAALIAALLFLTLCPWQLKIAGNAYVLPTRTATINAEVDGLVERINYREGDTVQAGAVIATLRSDDHRLNLNQAQARYDLIARELLRVQAVSGAAAAQIEQVKLDQARHEIALYRERVEQTQIRAPFDGVIVTPHLEEQRGRYLRRGEALCETADIDPVVIETAVPEDEIVLVQPGQEVWLKANAFPTRRFTGRVTRLSPQALIENNTRVFIVRAEIENPDHALRTGMVGRAKILTGARSVGYVLLRTPLRWAQKKLWAWLP
jgi:RND family efflux transporter MFP subunit